MVKQAAKGYCVRIFPHVYCAKADTAAHLKHTNGFNLEVIAMTKWEKPSYTDLRFGFEVTMYIYNR